MQPVTGKTSGGIPVKVGIICVGDGEPAPFLPVITNSGAEGQPAKPL